MNWTKGHSTIILALLAVVFLHIKAEPNWAAVWTPTSIGELGGQIITTVIAMFIGSPIPRAIWTPQEREDKLTLR